MTDTDVLIETREGLGRVLLNRPRALNALTHPMVVAIRDALDAWADDPQVTAVVLEGAGDRAFCAGGDIVSIYRDAVDGSDGALAFWQDEYQLNAVIAEYPKPIVAIMHGMVLGGGVGLACHASHRIVTASTTVGMPEVSIGFVPDVGGTFLLSRAPGESGTHLALTGESVGPGDAIALGLADHYVDDLAAFAAALPQGVEAAVRAFASAPPPATLDPELIDARYSGDDIEVIIERIGGSVKSPTALAVTLSSLRRAAALSSLREVLAQEFRVSSRMLRSHDTAEGIRAQVIDKDRAPHWQPATLADVGSVEEFFAPLPGGEWKEPE